VISNVKLYQPEIEGLRAIAVLAVLLFHLNISGFSGGFVGVDIFFVISGYLITKNIYSDLKADVFTFKSFYLRRIYRLLPALFVTIGVTLIASFFILTPEHFSALGSSSVASVFSVSNILFWSEAGYFDEAKAFKPLLHTWSLGVEEQFYLLWPLLLFLLYSKGKRVYRISILLLGIMSLLAAQSLLPNYNALVFYWMPLRISEFAVGAILVFMGRGPSPSRWGSLIAIFGLGLIVVPITMYSDQTAFPGVMALIPCVGTALLIWCGRAPVVFPLLANPLCRHLGQISYSLYLVHWPVIVLVSYWKLGGLGFKSLVVVIPIIYMLAWGLHHQVEQRFRLPKNTTQNSGRGYVISFFSILLLLLGTSVSLGNGWLWRYSGEAQVVINAVDGLSNSTDDKRRLVAEYQSSFKNQKNIPRHYIIGDSFAEDTLLALKSSTPDLNLNRLRIRAECQPVLPNDDYDESKSVRKSCNAERHKAFNDSQLKDATTIYLAASWREPSFSHLAKTIEFLKKNTSARIIIVGARASFHDVPTLVVKHGKESGLNEFVNRFKSQSVSQKNRNLERIANQESVEFINVYRMMCPSNMCIVISPFDKKIMYSDHAHLTVSGANYLAVGLKQLDSTQTLKN